MAYSRKFLYEPLRSIDSSTLTGSYQALGTPLAHPVTLLKLVNASSVNVTVSIDGSSDYDVAVANSFFLYDVTSNTPTNGTDAIFIPQGTQFYVKGSAGTGLIYLVALYIQQQW